MRYTVISLGNLQIEALSSKIPPLNEDDYLFIEQNSDLSKNDIDQFLLQNQKQPLD